MKIEMSPEAVGERLRAMNELWLLSTKLMNAKRVTENSQVSKKERALRIQDAIRQVLFYDWDPIGVSDQPHLNDEYDSYIGPVYRMLSENRSEKALADFLFRTERNDIGVGTTSADRLLPIARKLLSIEIQIEKPER